jgi:[calcium/calmodulin-dependent protein kinase] kinase
MSFFSSCFYCFAPKATETEEEKVLFDDDGDEISEKTNQVTLENVENEENDEKMNTDKTETYEDNSRKDETNKNKNNKRNKDSERDKKMKTSGSANNNEEENDRNSLSSNTGSSTSSTSSTNYNAQMKTPPQVANRRLGSLKLTPSVQKLSIIMDDKEHEQLNQYIMIKDLGRGAHAKVKLGLNKMDNNLYALKIRNERVRVAEAAVRKEIAILKKLSHPHVLKLHEVIDDTVSNELILVLEYAPGGPIFTRFNRVPLSEKVLHGYARDIVLGLDYLHSLEIAHMDLKPENMLKMADGVKLCDFGVSVDSELTGVTRSTRLAGTPAFLAPEMLDETGYDPMPSDVWSLGVCLYNMATARLPFTGKTVFQIVAMAKSTELKFPDEDADAIVNATTVPSPPPPKLSNLLKDMLRKMLVVDPKERISIAGMMEHPWVTEEGKKPLGRPRTKSPSMKLEVTEEDIDNAVRTNPLAAILQPAFRIERFKDGEVLMRKGEVGDRMYFINKGECEVLMDALLEAAAMVDDSSSKNNDNEDVLCIRYAGEIVGELAFLTAIEKRKDKKTPGVGYRNATVRAKGEVECLAVTVTDMLEALEFDESSRASVVEVAEYRNRQTEEVIQQIAESKLDDAKHSKPVLNIEKTLRILYAEDSLPTQMIVKALMRKIGKVELTIASNGREAVDVCKKLEKKEELFDLILMDCQMPVMDGLEATREIRKLENADGYFANIPIVAVSSGIISMTQDICKEAGMDKYVMKPLSQKLLVDTLMNALEIHEEKKRSSESRD